MTQKVLITVRKKHENVDNNSDNGDEKCLADSSLDLVDLELI